MFNHALHIHTSCWCVPALETLKEIDKLDLQHKQIKVTRQYGNMRAIDFETPKQSLTFIKR